MALINCPECNHEVSDKAIQCPRCAYPISAKTLINKNLIGDQSTEINLKEKILISDRKSETVAFILALLFGPFGLFYSNSDKAIRLIIYIIVIFFLLAIISIEAEQLFFLVYFIFWIYCLIVSNKSVKECNNSLLEDHKIDSKGINKDLIDNLRLLIRKEKDLPFYVATGIYDIIDLINKLSVSKEETIMLFEEYYERYGVNIVEELENLTSDKKTIKQFRAPFVKFNVIEENEDDI